MINLETTLALCGLAFVLVLGATLATGTPPPPIVEVRPNHEAPIAHLSSTDVDCIGKAKCLSEAEFAYDLASELIDNVNADITNRYMAYKHLMRTSALLTKGGHSIPTDMADLPTQTVELETELDQMFRQSRVNFHNAAKTGNHEQAVRELRVLKANFPERRSRYHIWAVEKERDMRARGVYPDHRVW